MRTWRRRAATMSSADLTVLAKIILSREAPSAEHLLHFRGAGDIEAGAEFDECLDDPRDADSP